MSARLAPALALVAGLVGCDDATGLRVDAVSPPYGPLVGGTRITVTGAGFADGAAVPNRVLIDGREAPLVDTVDDGRLEVVIPPGAAPGPAELVVLGGPRNAGRADLFRYSAPPEIAEVTPGAVLFSSADTTILVRGRGFLDEGAGPVSVFVDRVAAADVHVLDDGALTFTAPPGRPLAAADLELVDGRGHARRTRAFRYTLSDHPGLLLFPSGGAFAVFFDPVDRTSVFVPRINFSTRFSSVVRDDHGDYWAIDRSGQFGRIDTTGQRLESPIFTTSWFSAMVRVGPALYALDRGELRFGKLDPLTGQFTAIGSTELPCCGSFGLAALDGTLYLAARNLGVPSLFTVDPASGALGPPVALVGVPNLHIEELRAFDGTLYATTRGGQLVTIAPATGAVTVVPVSLGRASAFEIYQ